MARVLPFLIILMAVPGMATSVSSITCSGQTATVNATAHGLAASQGFELTGTAAQFNGTVLSATTNSFTFNVATGMCLTFTSGYTSVNPAQQIIELPGVANPGQGTVQENFLFWFTTVYPNPLPCNLPPSGTGCPQSVWAGASPAQNAAIVAGTTVEMYGTLNVPANTSATSVQSQAIAQYQTMQTGFAGYLLATGYCYNGSGWSTSCH